MRRALLGFALVALAVCYVELRLPSARQSAQGRDAVYERLAVVDDARVKLDGFSVGQIADVQ